MPRTPTVLPSAAQARADLLRDVRRATRLLTGILVLLWSIWLVDLLLGGRLLPLGLIPRTGPGLRGILLAPLLHSGLLHLLLNSLGLVLLGGLVLAREESHFWTVTSLGAGLGGLGTWVLGRSAIHIGASGVVFAYLGYLLLAGVFERRLGSILLSTVVGLLWGGMLFGLLPGQPGISWESHLFGFVAGGLAARLLARRPMTRPAAA